MQSEHPSIPDEDPPQEPHEEHHKLRHVLMLIGALLALAHLVKYLMAM